MMYREIMSISTSRSTAISRLLVRCAVLALFLTYGLSTHAQQERTMVDQPVKDDSIPLFRGFQVMTDLIGLGQLAFSNYGQYEVGVRVNLKDRYFPVLELGIGRADNNEITTGNHYKTSAPYGKIGIDFNVMKNKHDIYRLYGGVRFAYTSFKADYERPDVIDPVYGARPRFPRMACRPTTVGWKVSSVLTRRYGGRSTWAGRSAIAAVSSTMMVRWAMCGTCPDTASRVIPVWAVRLM